MRIGFGDDVHKLVTGRKLILGGVTIPYPRGLKGHSDADVLLHSICDSLLGAAGLKDIGHYFPNTDVNGRTFQVLCCLQNAISSSRRKSSALRILIVPWFLKNQRSLPL